MTRLALLVSPCVVLFALAPALSADSARIDLARQSELPALPVAAEDVPSAAEFKQLKDEVAALRRDVTALRSQLDDLQDVRPRLLQSNPAETDRGFLK